MCICTEETGAKQGTELYILWDKMYAVNPRFINTLMHARENRLDVQSVATSGERGWGVNGDVYFYLLSGWANQPAGPVWLTTCFYKWRFTGHSHVHLFIWYLRLLWPFAAELSSWERNSMVHEAGNIYHPAHHRKSVLSFAFSGTISREVVKGCSLGRVGGGTKRLWNLLVASSPMGYALCFLHLVSLTLRSD